MLAYAAYKKVQSSRAKKAGKAATSNMPSSLSSLVSILTAAVADLETLYESQNVPIPSLDEIALPEDPSDKLLMSPDGQKATKAIIGVCGMLTNLVQPAAQNVRQTAGSFFYSSCIRTAVEANVAEILREKGGERGLHINEIVQYNGADPSKLARVLRFLATVHVFRETAPDVFTNNRNSAALDTGRPIQELVKPTDKYQGTGQTSAWILHATDEVMTSSTALSEVICHPQEKQAESPFNKAFETDANFFAWLNTPDNGNRLQRFGFAMGVQKRGMPVTGAFPWNELPAGAHIVDVGGGTGTAMLPLYQSYPKLKYTVQDRAEVIEAGKKYWAEVAPDAISSNAVTLQPNDFFGEQPIKGADVYFLRMVIHDWADEPAVKILKAVRQAASKTSKLVALDSIIDHACPVSALQTSNIPGATPNVAPAPLLPNWGYGGRYPYFVDILMMHVFGEARERSVPQWERLFHLSGWRLVKVYRGEITQYIGEPV